MPRKSLQSLLDRSAIIATCRGYAIDGGHSMTTLSHIEINAINERLAIEIMGWHLGEKEEHQYYTHQAWIDDSGKVQNNLISNWNPYANIEQAMMVVERLSNPVGGKWAGFRFDLHKRYKVSDFLPQRWHAKFNHYRENADSPSEAICLAALAAIKALEG